MIIDPWLSRKGAFFGSWFQYPSNHYLKDKVVDLTKTKNAYVYLTHEHEDHFDIETISEFSSSTVFLIPKFKDQYLKNKIQEKSFKCLELEDGEPHCIDGFLSLKCLISDIGINHDSSVFVKTPDFSFFNQNDCKIFDRIDSVKEKIDFYSVQFSGATGHPVCYENYNEIDKEKISKLKTEKKLINVVNAIKKINPQYFIPAAGPAIFPFLEDDLSLGKGNIFIHQVELQKVLSGNGIKNILYPRPGECIDSSTCKIAVSPPTHLELSKYRSNISDVWSKLDVVFDKQQFIDAIEMRLDQIWDLQFDEVPIIIFKWGCESRDKCFVDLNQKIIFENLEGLERFL